MEQSGSQQRFALIGAAGFVAPRHMEAIKSTGNKLVCALDRFDVMGKIDSYFSDADFFLEPERFDRHLDKLRREKTTKIDYVSICSPNYLHDAHIRLALRNQAHAICEKPLVINPWNLDALQVIEREMDQKIFTILQLRLHPAIMALKQKIESSPGNKLYDIDLTYVTTRGKWYFISWKGDFEKSGGIATNIGIHFFDMLLWIFGDVIESKVHFSTHHKAAGLLRLRKANVRWFLSVDEADVPEKILESGQRTYRSITVEGQEVEFSSGFGNLHTVSYEQILAGNGFGIHDARASIDAAYNIRNARALGKIGDYHPMLDKVLR